MVTHKDLPPDMYIQPIYTCQEVILYLPSEVNTLFITLHYTDNVIYTCQEVILYLPSEDNALFITLHYTRYQEIRPPFSMLNSKHFEIAYALHHLYIMYSNVKTSSDVT
jgi:hypothetical protein